MEKYSQDNDVWVKIPARKKMFCMMAEQLLNHLLPAIAKVKSSMILMYEHVNEFPT